jgi:hypothetical protein
MKVVILNWSEAENNPFEFSSKNYAELLKQSGREVVMLELTDKNWREQLNDLKADGIEFVISFQGLGTNLYFNGKNFWDLIKLPIVCLHGDHPCHWPQNQNLDSRYCLHLYANAEWAQYANQHFHKKFAASVGARSLFPPEPLEEKPQGDFFVMAKNIKPPEIFEKHWKTDHPAHVSKAMLGASAMLRDVLRSSEKYVRIHELIDAYVESENLDFMKAKVNPVFSHSVHSQLDFYVRNLNSVRALEELHDVPVKVYGKGWDRLPLPHSSKHTFHLGLSTEDSRTLYNSRFGLIDISPAQGLHDRAKRAMSNKSSFSCNADMDFQYEAGRFPSIFFKLRESGLRQTAEVIMADPVGHRAACSDFATLYQTLHQPQDFLTRIENFARALVSE